MPESSNFIFVVSACLAGLPCRYDGKANFCQDVVRLVKEGKALPLCPEALSGLSVPRPPCELIHDRVVGVDGVDRTEAFSLGVTEAMRRTHLAGCRVAIVRSRSPSCGAGRVYDGTFTSRLVPGDGLWTAALRLEGIAIFTEENVKDALSKFEPR